MSLGFRVFRSISKHSQFLSEENKLMCLVSRFFYKTYIAPYSAKQVCIPTEGL